MENIIFRHIKNLFEHEEDENYYKPVRASNSWSNNYIEYESKGHKNITISVEKYHNKIRPYLKDIINNLKKSDKWKIQLTIAVKFISSRNNNEERIMDSKSDNIKIMSKWSYKIFWNYSKINIKTIWNQ